MQSTTSLKTKTGPIKLADQIAARAGNPQDIAATPYEYNLAEAFPDVDPQFDPSGSRILVQIRRPRERSAGGIVIPFESRDTDADICQVAKVIAVGPMAFKNRDTLAPWPEGAWCKPGDYIRVSRYGGDRWKSQIPGKQSGERAEFAIFKDLDCLGISNGDPLTVRAFI